MLQNKNVGGLGSRQPQGREDTAVRASRSGPERSALLQGAARRREDNRAARSANLGVRCRDCGQEGEALFFFRGARVGGEQVLAKVRGEAGIHFCESGPRALCEPERRRCGRRSASAAVAVPRHLRVKHQSGKAHTHLKQGQSVWVPAQPIVRKACKRRGQRFAALYKPMATRSMRLRERSNHIGHDHDM